MKWILIIVLILFVITGCSSSPFETSMRKGKDALKESNYGEAVKQFDLALIEEPRDEDARILLDQSLEGVKTNETKENLKKYQSEILSSLDKYKLLLNKYIEFGKEGLEHQNGFSLKVLSSILNDLKRIDSEFSKNKGILDINEKLKTSVSSLISYLNASDGSLFAKSGHTRAQVYLEEYNKLIDDVETP